MTLGLFRGRTWWLSGNISVSVLRSVPGRAQGTVCERGGGTCKSECL